MAQLVLGPILRHIAETSVTVWVETDTPCEVAVLGRTTRTFTVHGHHYALLIVDGLEPGSATPYEVHLDGEGAWPEPDVSYPPSVIRTLDPARGVRIVFGSCRHATHTVLGRRQGYPPDALDAYALRLAQGGEPPPDALLLLGDQIYADETSPQTREFLRERRGLDEPPGHEVADFEEYTALYRESWRDPDIRWLLSTVPSAMIFDDHDIRDDWNTSVAWRRAMQATSWWRGRITGGLASYWVYQHLGNLSPAELATDHFFQRVHDHADAGPLLDALAEAADAEVDDPVADMGAHWSYRWDLGRVRIVMVDTRCGRVLAEEHRSMLSDGEFAWLEKQVDGDYDHLVLGSSLPWLLPPAIHHVESWNEALCAGAHGPRVARLSEKLRQTGDLEHWAAFRASFDRLAALLAAVARGEGGTTPATVSVLSGDVHHAYVAEARYPAPTAVPVRQITCSPVHNRVPVGIKIGFRVGWSRVAAAIARPLVRLARVAPLPLTWRRLAGPFFGNAVATLTLDGPRASLKIERADRAESGAPRLTPVLEMPLTAVLSVN
jgi:hypothetical protein